MKLVNEFVVSVSREEEIKRRKIAQQEKAGVGPGQSTTRKRGRAAVLGRRG